MSIWTTIAKGGISLLNGGKGVIKGTGSLARAGGKSLGNSVVHPVETLKSAGSAMKSASIGAATGYVAWEKIVNDKSVVETVSDVVVGPRTTEKISEAVDEMKGLKDKASEAVDAVNGAMSDMNSKWSGMGNFFRGIFGGNGIDMFGNFFKNIGKGNVSGLSLAGLVTAAFLSFGRFGWLGKIAGAMLGMMLIGNNSNTPNLSKESNEQSMQVHPEKSEQSQSSGVKR